MNTEADKKDKTIPIKIQKQFDELRSDIESLQGILLSLANQLYKLTHDEQSK